MGSEFEPELLRRYGGNAPRYTSYPTAMQFHGGITLDDYAQAAARSGSVAGLPPLSLYVHIPFCADPCYYCACNRVITRQASVATNYVTRLLKEIELRSRLFDPARTVEQLHLGGGTPTYLGSAVLAEIMGVIGRYHALSEAPARDYSIEIDPRTVRADTLSSLRAAGFNRLSLGVQDFDEVVQRAINRRQSATMVADVLMEARALEFPSVNFDLIYGLPHQTLKSFAKTLERVIDMRPDRIALYGYAHMPALFKAQRQFAADVLPDANLRISLIDLAARSLSTAGYEHVGMDHFALPADPLVKARDDGTLHRNFQGYTTHVDRELINLGASAIGRIANLYVQNAKTVPQYQAAIDAGRLPLSKGLRLTLDDEIRADVIQQIMCRRRIDIGALERRWSLSFADYFPGEVRALEPFRADDLLLITAREIALTRRGSFLLRSIAQVFDAYASHGTSQARASRAI